MPADRVKPPALPERARIAIELDIRYMSHVLVKRNRLPIHYLKHNLVDVHGVCIRCEVVEFPDLGIAYLWVFCHGSHPHLVHGHASIHGAENCFCRSIMELGHHLKQRQRPYSILRRQCWKIW